jgi:alpha-L-rhamnosidase
MPGQLKCEYKENPIGIDIASPRLSWQIESTENNVKQSFFHIQISKNYSDLECRDSLVLDTGKIKSKEVFYTVNTIDLEPETDYFWRVGIAVTENEVKKEFTWSKTAKFTTGLSENSWLAKWIKSPSEEEVSLFRKDFSINKPVAKATLYGTALGIYDMKLNGKDVSDDRLAPGWTDYTKRIYYSSFDVTGSLKEGKNVLGGSVAPGWYAGYIGPLKERCFYGDKTHFSSILKIQYTDKTEEVIETDESWKTKADASTYADMIVGEEFDARLDVGNWTSPDYEIDESWKSVNILNDETILPKEIQSYPGVIPKPIGEFKALEIKEYQDSCIVDFGQNISGVVKLKLSNPSAGQKISRT